MLVEQIHIDFYANVRNIVMNVDLHDAPQDGEEYLTENEEAYSDMQRHGLTALLSIGCLLAVLKARRAPGHPRMLPVVH